MEKRATLQEIARNAGVSIATVSRYINGSSGISPEIRVRLEEVIRGMQYRKNMRLKKKSYVCGLVIPNVLNPFFPLLIKGVESVSKIENCSLVLYDSEDNVEIEEKNLERLKKIGADGLIFIASGESNLKVNELIEGNFPIVFLDRIIKSEIRWSVTSDNIEGAYQAVKYLINMGHKRILHLAGSANLNTELERFEGYKKALLEASIPLDSSLIISGGYHFESALEEMRKFLRGKTQFTSIFAANDVMALGAMLALKEKNLRVPQDVSIIGYDDIPFASLVGLTTVAQPAFEMGRNAIYMLINILEGKLTNSQHIVLRPSLVIRETCKNISYGVSHTR